MNAYNQLIHNLCILPFIFWKFFLSAWYNLFLLILCFFLSFISCYSTSQLDSMETDKLLMENEAVVVKTEYFEADENLFVSNP